MKPTKNPRRKARTPAPADGAKSTTASAKVNDDFVVVTAPDQTRLEVGAKVAILQYKHLKCARTGFVQSINGAYNYVRPDGLPVSPTDPTAGALELYPNEIKVLAVYRHSAFKPGTVVRIKNLDWGKAKPKSHGIVSGVEAARIIVQPIGAPKGAVISLPAEGLLVEGNDEQLSAEALAVQVAIIAVLRILNKPVPVSALKALLATQPGMTDIDQHIARLANAGKITLTESGNVVCIKSAAAAAALSETAQVELHGAVDGLAQAKLRLANAVHQAVVQTLS